MSVVVLNIKYSVSESNILGGTITKSYPRTYSHRYSRTYSDPVSGEPPPVNTNPDYILRRFGTDANSYIPIDSVTGLTLISTGTVTLAQQQGIEVLQNALWMIV